MSQESWASNSYDVGPTGYDDSPLYEWNKDFTLEAFKTSLNAYNCKDELAFQQNYENLSGSLYGDLGEQTGALYKTKRR